MATIDRNIASDQIEIVSLFSFFAKEKYLQKYVSKLARNGIISIGDLSRYDAPSLFEEFPTSPRNQEVIVKDLRFVGFNL